MTQSSFKRQVQFANRLSELEANTAPQNRLHLNVPGTGSLAAWFLGPRAENRDLFHRLLAKGLDANCQDRVDYFPNDPAYVTPERKDAAYAQSVAEMEAQYDKLLNALRGSIPFFSYRYQAHMNWDLTMPGLLGYFAAMLYNQNNVAAEASPVTSRLESQVGMDLCRMLGYPVPPPDGTIVPWGHITCDGSVANLESMWAARNLNYYAISIAEALRHEDALKAARDITVALPQGGTARLLDLDAWALQNLGVDEVLELAPRICTLCKIDSATITQLVDPYLLQSLGFEIFSQRFLKGMNPPVVVGTSTKHYSWPKNAAVLGIGKNQFRDVAVDEDARLSIPELRKQLDACVLQKTPVVMVVVVLGSTEQSAVDPLVDVLALRKEYQKKGLNFVIHVDAAWGGYFASMLRKPARDVIGSVALQDTPVLAMSDYVNAQYLALGQADSITIDPHKAGYIPYPAGGLCYRNSAMRNLVAFLAPEVYHQDKVDATMGVFGIEGSKPGAAAAAVYLSHSVIRPDQSGYGQILGRALFNSKRFFSAVITMAQQNDPFVVIPVQQIPAERKGGPPQEIEAQLNYIRDHIANVENEQLVQDTQAMALLKELGSDQIIITYGFNFKDAKGVLNADPLKANDFNQRIFQRLSLSPDSGEVANVPLIITTSEFGPQEYGQTFVNTYMRRLGLKQTSGLTMKFLSSTTMCPWLTDTAQGNFIPTLTRAFRQTVLAVIQEMHAEAAPKELRAVGT